MAKKWLSKEEALEVIIRYRNETEFAALSDLTSLEEGLYALIESHRWHNEQLTKISEYMDHLNKLTVIDTTVDKEGLLNVSELIMAADIQFVQRNAALMCLKVHGLLEEYQTILNREIKK